MTNLTTMLYQTQQIRSIEHLATTRYELSESALVLRAGIAAFKVLREYWPEAQRITVFCGKGNNGGDGYVLARLAHEHGLNVVVRYIGAFESLRGPALAAAQACLADGVDVQPYNDSEFLGADVLVDALLGIGLVDEIKEEYMQPIRAMNRLDKPILAIDIPSGIEPNTGRVMGVAVKATVTVTFLGLKQGLVTGQALEYCGEIRCAGLDLPESIYAEVPASAKLLYLSRLYHYLPPRERDANKGNFGHVLVVGGNKGMGGAARLAGEAAARVGAGLVSVATRSEHVALISGSRPELMAHATESPADLPELLKKATFIVIGPGLGQDRWAQELFDRIVATDLPMVVDGDALNLLAKNPIKKDEWILTPHPGEASRLLKCSVDDIQNDRFASVKKLQCEYGGVCVLKGAGTIIEGRKGVPRVCIAGNPGMASGGIGDVLSGVIAGLAGQDLSLEKAAQLGVLVHATAGDKVAREDGERGLLALDLMPELRKLVNP